MKRNGQSAELIIKRLNRIECMKKIISSNYKKDKYYKSVAGAVHELLKEKSFVAPVDLFMQMGKLSKEDYEDWRFRIRGIIDQFGK